MLDEQNYCVASNEETVLYCRIVATTAKAGPSTRNNALGLLLQLGK